MVKASIRKAHTKTAFCAALLAAFSCVLGLCFCLTKSPQARAEAYLGLAAQAITSGDSEGAASATLSAIRANPANASGWKLLSTILKEDGQVIASRQAANIAHKLQQNSAAAEPVYAMPAELKLSLLAMDSPGGTVMGRAGFLFTLICGVFTVFLLGWKGYQGASADWVYGFLAVFWSLLMMLRIMTLTEPAQVSGNASYLAQKLIETFRLQQEENRKNLLENAFGGSYLPFLLVGLCFAAWQVFCAINPGQDPALSGLADLTKQFLSNRGEELSWLPLKTFDWGQGFLLFLSFSMMGFVLRSHSGDEGNIRLTLIILSGYVVAGCIFFSGLGGTGAAFATLSSDYVGSGSGAASYLLGSIPAEKTLSIFDVILIESGIAGLAILAFLLFIPLGYIALSAQNTLSDVRINMMGMACGICLIFSLFFSFTPALGGYMGLCCMALFLAWGHAESETRELTRA